MTDLVTCIISSGRAHRVPAMARHAAGLGAVWVVPRGQEADYRRAGALRVEAVPGNLPAQRNYALDRAAAAGAWCVQLDDDLRSLNHKRGDRAVAVPVAAAVRAIAQSMEATGARLGGVAPTANAYFSRRELTAWGFVRGALCVLVPGPERYDLDMPLKSDWDMCCQHLAAYGKLARRDDLLADFAVRAGAGGCVAYRTAALEQLMCDRLLARWPALLRPHPRRAHELALLPRPKPAAAGVDLSKYNPAGNDRFA
jgi:hypothetical protein